MYEKHGDNQYTSRIYRIWTAMRQRCSKPYSNSYHRYGARGVTVCAEWDGSFTAFRDWSLANGYADSLSIDRIDGDKGYGPDNCRWADAKTQSANKGPAKSEKFAEHQGVTLNLSEWSRRSGIKYSTLMRRYNAGKRGDHLFAPVA